jgi:hypothetical protein
VINPTADALGVLVGALEHAGFYVDLSRARDAFARRGMFNAIEMQSACKIDFILRKDRPFSLEEFRRGERAEIAGGIHVRLATAEDTVVSKLEWARKSGESEKQLSDVAGILDVRGTSLDRGYVEKWTRDLRVFDLWERVTAPRDR